MLELLTPSKMANADATAIEAGTPGITLMQNAGAAVVDVLQTEFPKANRILIVCGTGNNGGDGFVAARLLVDAGKAVSVMIAGDLDRISGDAKLAFNQLDTSRFLESEPDLNTYDVIVDGIFGAGLDRPIEGKYADLIEKINASGCPVLAIDLPSGIDGTTGAVMGRAVRAKVSATFFRLKPGHLLYPGREYAGKLQLRQIGIRPEVLAQAGFDAMHNLPELWQSVFPWPEPSMHKYGRGHSLVISGPATATGAARLVAGAALRTGSGLVTLASPRDALIINANHLTSVMLREANDPDEILAILTDERFNCIAMGPGLPPDGSTIDTVIAVLALRRRTVLDAGALTAFEKKTGDLFETILGSDGSTVITPHEGEFSRLFPQAAKMRSKLERAKCAASISGAIVVLKGPDTVIASPDGRSAISANAPVWLATAGSGDVLAGIVTGLLAQGMPAFEAACAAVWFHGDAANRLGPGMISSDLDHGVELALRAFWESSANPI